MAIAADVRNGTALDAVLISLGANAEHGKRREAGDYSKAYDIACRYNLVKPADTHAVARLLRCSVRWAEMLTRAAREEERASRELAIQQGQFEGKSNRQIAGELGVSPRTVDRVVAASNAKSAEMTQASDDPDPYADARAVFGPAGQRWHRALEALQAVNAQAEVSAMFAERYTGVDHAIEPELPTRKSPRRPGTAATARETGGDRECCRRGGSGRPDSSGELVKRAGSLRRRLRPNWMAAQAQTGAPCPLPHRASGECPLELGHTGM